MPGAFCAVNSCKQRRGCGLPFFRCPKEEARCQIWRTQLGFTGDHRYANITTEQCYERIKICKLHFTDDSFVNSSKDRLNYNAIPTLLLSSDSTNAQNTFCGIESNETELQSGSDQTHTADVYRPKYADGQTQTETIKIEESSQTTEKISSNTALKKRLSSPENESTEIKKRRLTGISIKDVEQFLEDNYPAKSVVFLKAQLSLLNKAPRGFTYTDEFKQLASSIYFLSPKAYKKLAMVYRLPSKSSLERFTKHLIINPGFNDFIFRVTELKVRLLNEKAKDCILCIDEMSIKSHLYYDISKDKISGFHEGLNTRSAEIASSALVLMARGISSSWQQPIAYFFYKTSPNSHELKEILFQSVRKLNFIGLNVLGVVSDQCSNFYKLVRTTLNLTEENPCFAVDDHELVYMFDVPHLLKSTRNNFLSYKFMFNNEDTNKAYLEEMYNYDKTKQYRLAPKLSHDHIYPNSFQKRKVKLATQLFSHSVALAMFTYIDFNILPPAAKPTAVFIKKMNMLFDILNSNTLENFQPFIGTEKQFLVLKEMDNLFKHLKVVNNSGKNVTKQLKFIFGWRLTINSTLILFKTLQAKGYRYLFTRNLNQDCLEIFFSLIRNNCGHVKNPTSIQFCRAFKKILALQYSDQSEGVNCIEDINEVLSCITPDVLEQYSQAFTTAKPAYAPLKVFTTDYRNLKIPEGNTLVYVTGYFLRKCLLQHSCELCISFSTSNTLSEHELKFCELKSYTKTVSEGLIVPFKNIFEYVSALENIFTSKFGDLVCNKQVGKTLKTYCSNITFNHPCKNFPLDYFVSLYTRFRIYFSLKFANQEIETCRSNKENVKLSILQHM